MKLWTYGEMENRLRRDMDLLDDENFIGQDEMANLFNEAIDDAEAQILKVCEDYLLTSSALAMVQGQSDINLPSNIYAQKIRALIYANGPKIYPVARIRDPHLFYKKAEQDYYASGETEYNYLLKSSTEGQQDIIVLSPASLETGSYLTLWYIRNAKRVPTQTYDLVSRATQIATVIDIPEWTDFLIQFVKVRVYEKEMDPRLAGAMSALADRRQTMVETLSNRTPDNDDKVPLDMDFYVEHN